VDTIAGSEEKCQAVRMRGNIRGHAWGGLFLLEEK
jgi:hypothetical protein